MRVACLTVIYPGIETYFQDFINAFQSQSYKSAVLIVMNDGLKDPSKYNLDHNKVFEVHGSPAENRLSGLNQCFELNFDIVICADADETMCEERIQLVVEYFKSHQSAELVYNDSRYEDEHGKFDLVYKPRIVWSDILDFNVLGYGAMNVKRSLIPTLIARARTEVMAFDWWLAMSYLLHQPAVDFLGDAHNEYRKHADNFVGPLTEVTDQDIEYALKVKSDFYTHVADYCEQNGLQKQHAIILERLESVRRTYAFIEDAGIDKYTRTVQSVLKNEEKIYWWQHAMLLDDLNAYTTISESFWKG